MVVEAQKVEALCSLGEVDDPGLVGMQTQPERARAASATVRAISARSLVGQRTTQSSAYLMTFPVCVFRLGQFLVEDGQGDVAEQR